MRALANLIFTTDFFYSILRVTTPLLFASMGAVLSDVAGVPNIALEGMMLIAAFAGMFFSYLFDSAAMGLLFALLFAVLSAGVLAFFTLYYKTNIILGGIAINSLASGGTIFFLYLAAHDKGTSVSLPSKVLPSVNIPLNPGYPGDRTGHLRPQRPHLPGHCGGDLHFLPIKKDFSRLAPPGGGREEGGGRFRGNQRGEDSGHRPDLKRPDVRLRRSVLCPWATCPGFPETWSAAGAGSPWRRRPWDFSIPWGQRPHLCSSAWRTPCPTPWQPWAGL